MYLTLSRIDQFAFFQQSVNSLKRWPLVLVNLKKRGCPKNVYGVIKSYFEDRNVHIKWGDRSVSKKASRGCPQGSVLGPTLWNIQFDELLDLLSETLGENFLAYADDLFVLVRRKTQEELKANGQRVVNIVHDWCQSAKLQFSETKTVALYINRPKSMGNQPKKIQNKNRNKNTTHIGESNLKTPTLRIGNNRKPIKFVEDVKYLGVIFDKGLRVSSHCKYLREKVSNIFVGLRKPAGSTWGIEYTTSKIVYKGVLIPILTYASAAWYQLTNKHCRKDLFSARRIALRSVVKSYSTTAKESL